MLVTLEKFGKTERPAVTSLDVAETFGKRHDHVLRDIKELGCSDEFRFPNFGETYYLDTQGRKQRMVVMTRDGFTLLVMGYTGELAMKFKEAYIRQFNAMESARIAFGPDRILFGTDFTVYEPEAFLLRSRHAFPDPEEQKKLYSGNLLSLLKSAGAGRVFYSGEQTCMQ